MSDRSTRVRVVGAGRAGGSFAAALSAAGWQVEVVHHDEPVGAPGGAGDVDLELLCVPDAAVAGVARARPVREHVVVAHCAGSLPLDVLGPHPRRAAVHPLVSLPDPATGAARLQGAWFAVAGDEIARRVVAALGGTAVEVADADRARYHATAAVAANHLVGLMGQVERLAASVDVPLEAFLALARGALDNVAAVGPSAALTGPVARGDWATVRRHLDALAPGERQAYLTMAEQAAVLVGRADELDAALRGGAPADGGGDEPTEP